MGIVPITRINGRSRKARGEHQYLDAVIDFFEHCHAQMIYKTLSGGMIVSESGDVVSIYTSGVTRDDLLKESQRVR